MENEITCHPQHIVINEIRTININYKEVVYLLQQLSSGPKISKQDYLNIIQKLPKNQFIFIITDKEKHIGMITLFIEQKIIHCGGKVGHIEDLIVDKEFRNKGYGKLLLQHAVAISKLYQCYKCILNCKENLKPFYEKNGFTQNNNGMSLYFTPSDSYP